MWLYFNENGQLLEALAHGSQPRSGTTDFELVAFFEGKNIRTRYTMAQLRLVRPDLDETVLRLPNMSLHENERYDANQDEHPIHFQDKHRYDVYRFDFTEDMADDDGQVCTVLDMPGQWKAVITLSTSDGRDSVQGELTFGVGEGAIGSDQAPEIPYTVMFSQLSRNLSGKATIAYVDSVAMMTKTIHSVSITDECMHISFLFPTVGNISLSTVSDLIGYIQNNNGMNATYPVSGWYLDQDAGILWKACSMSVREEDGTDYLVFKTVSEEYGFSEFIIKGIAPLTDMKL